MIKTSEDILYNRIKNAIGFDRSKKFKKWFHEKYPDLQMHHCYGSYTGIKTSDYCSVPMWDELHYRAEKNKSDFAIEYLPFMLQTMISYIKFLENENDNKSRNK